MQQDVETIRRKVTSPDSPAGSDATPDELADVIKFIAGESVSRDESDAILKRAQIGLSQEDKLALSAKIFTTTGGADFEYRAYALRLQLELGLIKMEHGKVARGVINVERTASRHRSSRAKKAAPMPCRRISPKPTSIKSSAIRNLTCDLHRPRIAGAQVI